MVFAGYCPRCGGWYQWTELSRELSCLEAKNAGVFGGCGRGVSVDDHAFDQECDSCVLQQDEGVDGLDDNTGAQQVKQSRRDGEANNGQEGSGGSSGKGDKGKNKKRRTK